MSVPRRVVALVQARMNSERLPGKVLLDIAGQPMLSRVVRRLRHAQLVDEVVVATSTSTSDDAVVAECGRLAVRTERGSEPDVLGRFVEAAARIRADAYLRVSADSPFIDAEVCDLIVSRYLDAHPPVDYVSNKLEPSFPLGLDAEVFSHEALVRAGAEATALHERSHVTVYMYQNPGKFRLASVRSDTDRHRWRWTVDTAEDLAFAREVFSRFGGRDDFSWREVVMLIEREPALADMNRHVVTKSLNEG